MTAAPTWFPAARATPAAELLVADGAAEVVVTWALTVGEAAAVVAAAVVATAAAEDLLVEEAGVLVKLATSRVPQLAWMSVLHLPCPTASSGWALMQAAKLAWQM